MISEKVKKILTNTALVAAIGLFATVIIIKFRGKAVPNYIYTLLIVVGGIYILYRIAKYMRNKQQLNPATGQKFPHIEADDAIILLKKRYMQMEGKEIFIKRERHPYFPATKEGQEQHVKIEFTFADEGDLYTAFIPLDRGKDAILRGTLFITKKPLMPDRSDENRVSPKQIRDENLLQQLTQLGPEAAALAEKALVEKMVNKAVQTEQEEQPRGEKKTT